MKYKFYHSFRIDKVQIAEKFKHKLYKYFSPITQRKTNVNRIKSKLFLKNFKPILKFFLF